MQLHNITFYTQVKVTSLDRFSLIDSLNFLGSNLGLWPGLGLYQVLEWTVGTVAALRAVRGILSLK